MDFKKFMRLVNSNFKSVGTAVLSYEPQGSMPTMEKARAAEQVIKQEESGVNLIEAINLRQPF